MGPVELIAIQFPGNDFSGEIVPELRKVLQSNVIRMVDLVFVRKGKGDEITVTEVNDLGDEEIMPYTHLLDDLAGLLTPEDIDAVANALPENSSVAIMLFEHVWAAGIREAILNAGGEVVLREHVPWERVEALSHDLDEHAEQAAGPSQARGD